jgi:RNA polymerase sigma-70 factor, ECF subfamily
LRPSTDPSVFSGKRGRYKVVGAVMTPDIEDEASSPPLADAAELTEIWADFAPPLRAFLARRVPPGVDAEDLVQDVFLRVIRHADTLRSAERPEAWLFQVARNALRDSLRVRLRRDGRTDALDVDVPAEADDAADQAAEAELAPCLTAMIGRLAEPYRTAITLTSLQGLTQAEAARLAGVSISGMKSRVQRGRDQLRGMLVRCCSIAVDVRGGVSDFHKRQPGACGAPAAAAGDTSCAPGPCGSNDKRSASIPDTRRLQH